MLSSIHTQAFCSSITGTLATLAILKGVGVGDKEATPLAATITWMLKGLASCMPFSLSADHNTNCVPLTPLLL